MNVTVENLAPCKKLVRVELDAQAVDESFAAVTNHPLTIEVEWRIFC